MWRFLSWEDNMNERDKMMKKTNIFWTLKVSKTWHLWFHFPIDFLLLFSICQFFKVKTLLFEWQHLISLKLWYLHSIPLFEQKRCHFLDLRAKESEEKVTTNSARQKHSILQKNEQKKYIYIYPESSQDNFLHFLFVNSEELKIPKSAFEIYWPLVTI